MEPVKLDCCAPVLYKAPSGEVYVPNQTEITKNTYR
jgi:hypothetical protein